jgi:hypothetical protein
MADLQMTRQPPDPLGDFRRRHDRQKKPIRFSALGRFSGRALGAAG